MSSTRRGKTPPPTFEELPAEIYGKFSEFLDPESILTVAKTSKTVKSKGEYMAEERRKKLKIKKRYDQYAKAIGLPSIFYGMDLAIQHNDEEVLDWKLSQDLTQKEVKELQEFILSDLTSKLQYKNYKSIFSFPLGKKAYSMITKKIFDFLQN